MARPFEHPRTGVFYARKVVPAPLRPFLGGLWELKESLGTKDEAEARRLHPAVMARIEAKLAVAKVKAEGAARVLTGREIEGVMTRWCREEAAKGSEAHGDVAAWEARQSDAEVEELFDPTPDFLAATTALLWAQGMGAEPASLDRAARRWAEVRTRFAVAMVAKLSGDVAADPSRAAEPVANLKPAATPKPPGLSFTVLLDKLAAEVKPLRKTQDKRVALFARFAQVIGHDDAEKVTKADVRAWKEYRQAAGVVRPGKAPQPASPKTIDDDVALMRGAFNWAIDNGLLEGKDNPFARMGVKRAKGGRPARLPFTDEDAAAILTAARGERGFLRWLPWLLAFSGARIEEACGAQKEDVRQERGVWVLDIVPRYQSDAADDDGLKNAESQRMMPLHTAVIAEGFLDYVASLPAGSPLFPDLGVGHYGRRGETATKRHGRWLRLKVGIKDPRKAPAHSWRHRMEDEMRRARLLPEVQDAITGRHNPRNAGAGYGLGFRGMPEEVLKELQRIPSPLAAD